MSSLKLGCLVAMLMGSPWVFAEQVALPESRSLNDAQIQAGSAFASQFHALDVNHDGYVSRSEALADPEVASKFINFDETQDDRLNRKEFAKLSAPSGLSIHLPINLGIGGKPKIEIRPATPPRDTGPDIAP